ncbi:MAG: hypothetical protein JW940_22325 [Polyangiaceae bacterium]|nr:hypothetical protein [Polyangiaceae bacterium]
MEELILAKGLSGAELPGDLSRIQSLQLDLSDPAALEHGAKRIAEALKQAAAEVPPSA